MIAVPSAFGQDAESLEIFESIPSNERSRLAERLKIFLDFYRTKQYSQLFDMFPKFHTQHPEITKEQFLAEIKKFGKSRIIDFTVENTIPNESIDGDYAIWGCAKVKDGWSSKKRQATIYASIENGEWVLSDVYFSFQLEARDSMPCSPKKKK
jgi:hypothetical protein